MHQVTMVNWSVQVNDQCIGVVRWVDGKIEISVNRTCYSPEELDALVKAAETAKASHLKRSVELPGDSDLVEEEWY